MSPPPDFGSFFLGSGASTNYAYWRRFPSITIWEAACIYSGHDPRAMSDVVGADGSGLDLSDEERLLISACNAQQIDHFSPSGTSICSDTPIDRQSFACWLMRSEPTKEIGEQLASDTSAAPQPVTGEAPIRPIPGKLPRTAASRLAIVAAWEIECEFGRAASVNEVFERLVEWSNGEQHIETLRPYNPKKKEIPWVTSKGEERSFSREACTTALSRWKKSRCIDDQAGK